ncbi:DNA-binding response regulator [Subtercola boreus]|uniref:DNA-binding response regulator n=1 Tax=Subtercola boreus TaxID=120213 RepID=A0A3E0VM66_9MICO|nr:response regulator transcription factor [Subtercola boreus]RFA10558.1 DNA-binding response regulator [Subtercola boreus]TQL55901.1 LuxR family two component transcriptional regulator [Subtercola boreus]
MTDIRLLLVDDQALLRLGFRMVLEAEPGFVVVGEASDGASGVREATALRPDVILMDVRMPGMNGIEATRAIVREVPESRVLILTTFDLDEYAFEALRAGASGFLLKDARPAELVAAINAVASGDAAVSPRVTRQLLELFGRDLPGAGAGAGAGAGGGAGTAAIGGAGGATGAERREGAPGHPETDGTVQAGRHASRIAALTEREREVLVAIAEGLTNTEIAGRLVVSESTVKSHVGRVLTKLQARDRVQAVILAYEAGLVGPLER